MTAKHRLFALLAGLLFAGMVPGLAFANPPGALDQHQDSGPSYGGGEAAQEAQTFTAGITGQMTTVGLLLAINGSETVNVSIQTLDGSLKPSGTVLATGSATVTGTDRNVSNWVYFTLNAPVSVVSGNQYAIAFSVTNSYFFGDFSGGNPYAGGQDWFFQAGSWTDNGFNAYDLAFQTYVTVAADPTVTPPPTATQAPTVTQPPTATQPPAGTLPPTSAGGPSGAGRGTDAAWPALLGLMGLIAALAVITVRRRQSA